MQDNRARTVRSIHLHRHNCPITLSNYKHDVYTVLLVLKSGW